ncbi:MAG: FAD-binding oxidoreductase [Cyanobacteriota bacterium]|nr:FAD-binding oxidoreductase [Cyanobacteriota bacterium]
MKIYDWIIVGAGITGAALSYELALKGFSVLLLEQDPKKQNATRFSYGGVSFSFWSGTTALTHQLFQEGVERHRNLSSELDTNTQFREIDLLLPIAEGDDPDEAAASCSFFGIPPTFLIKQAAKELEPLLNTEAIVGALSVRHGHVSPEATVRGYCEAFVRHGGTIEYVKVTELVREGDRVVGVSDNTTTYPAANTIVCAGGFSRDLLKSVGLSVPVYFTHAEILETPPVEVKLRTLVMSALQQRAQTETVASQGDRDRLWDEEDRVIAPPVLDAGAIQFQDKSIRIGQISRTLTNPRAEVDAKESEGAMREAIGKILPPLANLPATWHRCLVAFSNDALPLIGAVPNIEGVQIFSGFTSALVLAPPLAKRFANYLAGEDEEILGQFSPSRFMVR